MKVAVLIAHTASGWHSLSQGSDIPKILALFKNIKVAGVLEVGTEQADCVMYFDSGGVIGRKFLRDKITEEARQKLAALNAAANKAEAEKRAQAEGQSKATEVAQQVVGVIANAIAGAAEEEVEITIEDVQRMSDEIARLQEVACERASKIAYLSAALATAERKLAAAPVVSAGPGSVSEQSGAAVTVATETAPSEITLPTNAEASTPAPDAAGAGATAPASNEPEGDDTAAHFGGSKKRQSGKRN